MKEVCPSEIGAICMDNHEVRSQHVDGGYYTLSFLDHAINGGPGYPMKPVLQRLLIGYLSSTASIFISSNFHLFLKRKMSCCGGNCGCGSSCSCGSGCGGCKMYPDMGYTETTTTETLIVGVAPQKTHFEGSEMAVGAENGCKCGSNCTCDPCNCK